MKRNRTKYIVYVEPWTPGKHRVFNSKLQMKKFLKRCNAGSEGFKERLIHSRDGSISLWNIDLEYSSWLKT